MMFTNIVPSKTFDGGSQDDMGRRLYVEGAGGSRSGMMRTSIGEMEWSAIGLAKTVLPWLVEALEKPTWDFR